MNLASFTAVADGSTGCSCKDRTSAAAVIAIKTMCNADAIVFIRLAAPPRLSNDNCKHLNNMRAE
jgi:hypothetical protein